jgi:hypothetical protein
MKEQLTTKRTNRRSSINGTRNVLNISGKEPGYVYRVVNDTGDRIEQLKEIGYEIVEDSKVQVGDRRVANPTKEGSPIKVSVGQGIQGYVMRIKQEWYDEDKAKKDARVNAIERGLVREAKEQADYGKLTVGKD